MRVILIALVIAFGVVAQAFTMSSEGTSRLPPKWMSMAKS